MKKFDVFFKNIQNDLKLYAYLMAVIFFFRLYFLIYMHGYIGNTTPISDVFMALWTGFRLSLKTAGAGVLLVFLIYTIPSLMIKRIALINFRYYFGCFYTFLLTILFQARFPYYEEFHVGFNQNIFNGIKDDTYAIFVTLVQEYSLISRFLLAILLTYFLCKILKKILSTKTICFPRNISKNKIFIVKISIVLFIPLFMLFMRFGGSFNYTYSVNWENAGKTRDSFLNELILDDIQALYRANTINKQMREGNISLIKKDELINFLVKRNININSKNLDDYLLKKAKGNIIEKPKHIFIIMGESYAQWPIMSKYEKLEVAKGIKGLISKENSYYTENFLPNGTFTSMALIGMITGFNDINIYANHQPLTYKEVFPTSMANQFKKLGYKTSFWYGGFPSWERLEDFSKAQGFDEFHSCVEFDGRPENIWGSKDALLFKALEDNLVKEEATVHLIMTVTNHPPYNLDLASENIDENKIYNSLINNYNIDDKTLAKELAHYQYMDREISSFILNVSANYPDSLFVVTGDHADRTNIGKNPTMYERYSIPLLIFGKGINKKILPSNVAGGHTNISPTIIELIAPKGFEYYSIAPSLTDGSAVGFNKDYWISNGKIGRIDNEDTEDFFGEKIEITNKSEINEIISEYRTISWWRLMRGKFLIEED